LIKRVLTVKSTAVSPRFANPYGFAKTDYVRHISLGFARGGIHKSGYGIKILLTF
jgi:hypothetical protein